MPPPAARGDPWWPWALWCRACWGLQQSQLHLGRKKPPQLGIFMGFGASGNQTCAPSTWPSSHILRGFAILSFFSRSIQTVKGRSAGLGVPGSVRGYVVESSLFWARSGVTKTPRALQRCQWGLISGNLLQIKPGLGPFVFLCMNYILLGKANTYYKHSARKAVQRDTLSFSIYLPSYFPGDW